MKIITFLFINFVVGFLSDIILNDLSRQPTSELFKSKIIQSLKIYFINKSIIHAAFNAGITVVIILIPTILLFTLYSNIFENKTLFTFFAFIMGFIADIIIDKLNIFGDTLKPFYKLAGSGLLGGLAIAFSVIISYLIHIYLLPILI
jgi:uncharacterized membrane protein